MYFGSLTFTNSLPTYQHQNKTIKIRRKHKITDRNGVTHEVAAPTDMAMNLMEIVKLYELAEEGTIMFVEEWQCASCQCYGEPLPGKSDEEEAMLSEAYNVKENSRLGCQIHITEDLEGLEVELAPYE